MIDGIRAKIAAGPFEFTRHALDGSLERRISVAEVREAVATGEAVEDYPNDKYGPSCLLFGRTLSGRALHVQCGHPSRGLVTITTLYEPDPALWIDCKLRRIVR